MFFVDIDIINNNNNNNNTEWVSLESLRKTDSSSEVAENHSNSFCVNVFLWIN